jgi:hypothetical protein
MNVLITGVSGSGKTTIASELTKRGYHALNMDQVDGLSAWVDVATREVAPDNRETVPGWLEKYDWRWDKKKLQELLDQDADTFFCGSSGNQAEFYSLFDNIILLEMNDHLIHDRIFNNERDHTYGRRPGELEAILGYYRAFQDTAKAAGAKVVNPDQPLDKVVDDILSETTAT